jgi:regulator of protease activity HflC (stomatin/prohibitin superfamily)
MQRSTQKYGLINLLLLAGIGLGCLVVAQQSHSLAGQIAVIFLGFGALVALVSWFQMRLEDRERLERLEFEELQKSHSASAMFESKDAEVFPAQRSREQFERYFVPVFTAVLFVAQTVSAYLIWRWLTKLTINTEVTQPTVALSLFSVGGLLFFMFGKFSASIARLENHRLLRPGSSYVLLGAYLCFLVALGIVGVEAGFLKSDYYVAIILCVVLVLTAFETLVQLVLEIYRPRVKGKVERPLYESRIIGLLGQPEGLITTAAQALDYQFGFKVSETWFYRLLKNALAWVILLQVAALLLSTCVVFIEAGEQGLLERFGTPVAGRTPLGPGAHFKWPWPIDQVYRFRTQQIQSFDIGFSPDPNLEKGPVVLWATAHRNETNFLVANRLQSTTSITNLSGKRTPPVSLLTVSIPVQFQITNVVDWEYNNEDAPSLLADLGAAEVVRYLASSDMGDIMSHGRLQTGQVLMDAMQKAANDHRLGAQIVSVDLEDLHPPLKVAGEYEKVIASIQNKEAKILAARADAIRTNALAGAEAGNILNKAHSESLTRRIQAVAQAALFTNQIPAFEAAPLVYAQRAYLQTFARATASAQKFVLLTTNTQDVLVFDLQQKISESILDIPVAPPKKTTP